MALTRITSNVIKDATIQEGKFDKQYLDSNQSDIATQPITFQSNVVIKSGPAGTTYFNANPANEGSITLQGQDNATTILNILVGNIVVSDGDIIISGTRRLSAPYVSVSDGSTSAPSLYFDPVGVTGLYRVDDPESLDITVGGTHQVGFSPTEGVKFTNRNIKISAATEYDDILRFRPQDNSFLVGGTTPNLRLIVSDTEGITVKDDNGIKVGIDNDNPTSTLDVGGAIKANGYLNIQSSDLPVIVPEKGGTGLSQVGFPEQLLRVNASGNGFEYFTLNSGDLNNLASFNVSGDGTLYDVVSRGTDAGNRLTLSLGIENTFITGQDIKIFGINTKNIAQYDQNSAGTTTYSTWASTIDNSTSFISAQGGVGGGTRYTYYAALINFNTGVISSLKKLKHSSSGAPDYVVNYELDTFNEQRYNSVSILRPNASHGILLYRYKNTLSVVKDRDGNTIVDHDKNLNLIAILGQRDIGSATTTLFTYNDYGPYNRVTWGDFNTDGSYNQNYLEIKSIPATLPTTDIPSYGPYPGWVERQVYEKLGTLGLTVSNSVNSVYDETDLLSSYIDINRIQICHDDTNALIDAIQSVMNKGLFSLFLTGGTYLVKNLPIPSNVSIYGSGKATVIKKQYFDTSYNRTPSPEYSRMYSAVWLRDPWGGGTYGTYSPENPNYSPNTSVSIKDVTLRDFVVDGNYNNNIRLGDSARPDANALVYLEDAENCNLVNLDIRNSIGDGINATSAKRISIQNTSVYDNSITYGTFDIPLQATDAEVLKVSDCAFLGNPGPVDITTSQVVAFNSCIIRNSGTGLRIFGARSANTENNLILGPDDEWIPTTDIYDSDFNSVNLTCYKTTGAGTQGWIKFTYVEENVAKDLRNTTIRPYVYQVTVDVNGNETLAASPLTYVPTGAAQGSPAISVLQATTYDIENGGVQIRIPSTATLPPPSGTALGAIPYRTNPGGIGLNYNYLVYYVVGDEAVSVGAPDNYSISGVITGGYDPINQIYTIKIEDEFVPDFVVEDVVTLYEHNPTSGYSIPTELTVVAIRFEDQSFVLDLFNSGFNTFNQNNNPGLIDAEGNLSVDPNATGYIKKKNTFTIAKGIIGVV